MMDPADFAAFILASQDFLGFVLGNPARERARAVRAEVAALTPTEYLGCRLVGEAVTMICEQYGFTREQVEQVIIDGCVLAIPTEEWAALFETPESFAALANYVATTLAGPDAAGGLAVTIH